MTAMRTSTARSTILTGGMSLSAETNARCMSHLACYLVLLVGVGDDGTRLSFAFVIWGLLFLSEHLGVIRSGAVRVKQGQISCFRLRFVDKIHPSLSPPDIWVAVVVVIVVIVNIDCRFRRSIGRKMHMRENSVGVSGIEDKDRMHSYLGV